MYLRPSADLRGQITAAASLVYHLASASCKTETIDGALHRRSMAELDAGMRLHVSCRIQDALLFLLLISLVAVQFTIMSFS